MNQEQKLLNALKRGKRVNPMYALYRLGIYRLSARIYDLREKGHVIDTQMVGVGNGKRVAGYVLVKACTR